MKLLFTFLAFQLIFFTSNAQVPQRMTYQAVVRNATNVLVTNQAVGLQVSILQGTVNGNPVFVEQHFVNTNANGLVTIQIGTGWNVSGTFSTIDWSNGPYFIKTETDIVGGTNFTISGTTQLLSVPYALYAETSGSSTAGPPGTQGVSGQDGNTVLHGSGSPTIQGVSGDFYLDTVTHELYGPMINGVWNSPVSLIGPQGITGQQGPQGPQGPLGSGFTHYLGEIFGGGVIFHLWKDNLGIEHGLIVDLQNLAVSAPWANNINTSIGAPAKSLWDGENNSNAIIAAPWHTSSAAALCVNSTNSGYSDWYLPSIDELKLLRENSFSINKSFSSIPGASPLTIPNNYTYWSSTETIPLHALSMFYLNSVIVASNKSTNFAVRAIRSF